MTIYAVPGDEEDALVSFTSEKYPSNSDLSMRLSNSLILVGGEPVLVSESAPNSHSVYVQVLSRGIKSDPVLINVNDDSVVDISAMRLGYVNWGKGAYYLYRAPERRQKQGIELSRLLYREHDLERRYSGAYNNSTIFGPIRDMLTGTYPSFDEAYKNPHGLAFHRKFAVSRFEDGGKGLAYLGNDIGCFLKSGKLLLSKQFNCPAFRRIIHAVGVPE